MSKRLVLILTFLLATLSLLAFSLVFTRGGERPPMPTKNLDGSVELQRLVRHWVHPDSSRYVTGWVRLYEGAGEGALKEELPFLLQQDKGRFYGRIGPVQNFCDGRLLVQVDTLNRYLQAEPVQQGAPKGTTSLFPLEGWAQDSAGLHIRAVEKDGMRTLTLTREGQPDLKACRIYYEPGTYRVLSSEMEWWKPQALTGGSDSEEFWRTRIEYRYWPPETLDMEALIGRYLLVRGSRVRLQPAYKEYQVSGALFTN